MAPTTKETKPPAKDGTKGVKKDAAKSPAKGAAKAPAKGATKAPVKGATKAPAKGATKAPAKGATKAPAKGATKAPAKGATKGPAKGATKAPAKGAKGSAKAPAKGAKGSAKAPAKGAVKAKGANKISVKKSTKLSSAKKPIRSASKKPVKKRTMEIAKESRNAKEYVIHLKQQNKKIRLNPSRFGTIRYGVLKKKIINVVAKPPKKRKAVKSNKAPAFVTKPIGGEKNGGTRTVRVKKTPSYYPTKVSRRTVHKKKNIKHSLKKSLQPGVVCIVVAGPHKGKRVVFLKQLASGLCLITGPFLLNRCPLRRINQIYLIGTTLKLDLPEDFKVPERLTDNYFKRVRLNKKPDKKDGGDIFTTKSKKYTVSAIKREDQKIVDVQVFKAIKKNPERKYLQAYMSNKFSLKNHQFPHKLKF